MPTSSCCCTASGTTSSRGCSKMTGKRATTWTYSYRRTAREPTAWSAPASMARPSPSGMCNHGLTFLVFVVDNGDRFATHTGGTTHVKRDRNQTGHHVAVAVMAAGRSGPGHPHRTQWVHPQQRGPGM